MDSSSKYGPLVGLSQDSETEHQQAANAASQLI